MHEYDAENPRVSNTGVIPDNSIASYNAELVIEGFDNSGFHLRIADFYYCAKNVDDLISVCFEFFGSDNSDRNC